MVQLGHLYVGTQEIHKRILAGGSKKILIFIWKFVFFLTRPLLQLYTPIFSIFLKIHYPIHHVAYFLVEQNMLSK